MSRTFLISILVVLGILMYIMSSAIRQAAKPEHEGEPSGSQAAASKPAAPPPNTHNPQSAGGSSGKSATTPTGKPGSSTASGAPTRPPSAPLKPGAHRPGDISDDWFKSHSDGDAGRAELEKESVKK